MSNPSPMRIAKFLSAAGICSRREAERRIEQGRVRLDGAVLTSAAVLVSGCEHIEMDGASVGAPPPARLWRFHKPRGVLTTRADPRERPTLFECLPASMPRVLAIGRLDLQTEGLLLLSNDGELARALELPATGFVRRYEARVHGRISQKRLEGLERGVCIDGVCYRPIRARLLPPQASGADSGRGEGKAGCWLELAFAEGKNREARRVLESLNLRVSRLVRTNFGPLSLGELKVGAVQELPPRKLVRLFGSLISKYRLPATSPVGIFPRAG